MPTVIHIECDTFMEAEVLLARLSPNVIPAKPSPYMGSSQIGDGFDVGDQADSDSSEGLKQDAAEAQKPEPAKKRGGRKSAAEKDAAKPAEKPVSEPANEPAKEPVTNTSTVSDETLNAAREELRGKFQKLMEAKQTPEQVRALLLTPFGAKLVPDLTAEQIAEAIAIADAKLAELGKPVADTVFG